MRSGEPIKKFSASLPSRRRVHLARTPHRPEDRKRGRLCSFCSFYSRLQLTNMYRNIRFSFLAIILLLCLTFNSDAEAQLNFSTGWGKRSSRVGVSEWGGAAARPAECAPQARPSLDQLLTVYHLIQMEARRMLDCRND